MPKRIKFSSTTTYLPAPPPVPLPPPPAPASILAQQQGPSLLPLPPPLCPATALPPLPQIGALPLPSHPSKPDPAATPPPELTSDPIRIVTWGPHTYIHNPNPKTPRPKVNKDGYLIRKGPAPVFKTEGLEKGRCGRVPNLTDVESLLGTQAEGGQGRLQISLEGRNENYTTQMVETLPDGAVRRMWVTRVAVVTVETERPAGMDAVGEEQEEDESESESESGSDNSDSDSSNGSDGSGTVSVASILKMVKGKARFEMRRGRR